MNGPAIDCVAAGKGTGEDGAAWVDAAFAVTPVTGEDFACDGTLVG
jgi:hypothetical protein